MASLWTLKLFFHYFRPETLKSGQMLHCCSLKHFLLGIQTSMPLKWKVKFRNNLKNSMYVFHVAELLMDSALSGPGVCLGRPPVSACALPAGRHAIQIFTFCKGPISPGAFCSVGPQCFFLFSPSLLQHLIIVIILSFLCVCLSPQKRSRLPLRVVSSS